MSSLINIYEKEVEVNYKDEKYSVRDNGAVMRHPKNPEKPRRLDNVWTFGTINKQKGYLFFSSEAVHRIVASAFLGTPPTPQYVVDHRDTNRQNNRPENLMWVTKLENILLNPRTRKKIELLCNCSISDILKDITILHNAKLDSNFEWMRTVTKEEAAYSLARWDKWVETAKRKEDFDYDVKKYLLSNRNSGTKGGIYPCEPTSFNSDLNDYYNNLAEGKVFFEKEYYNEKVQFTVSDFYYDKKRDELSVAQTTRNGIKNYYFTVVTRKNDRFEYNTRSCFSPLSVEKYMALARGLEWTGGEVIDDYC